VPILLIEWVILSGNITGMDTRFYTDPRSMEPLMPEGRRSELQDLAWQVGNESASLSSTLNTHSRAAVAQLLRIVNSYYSNLIEGHATLPGDIERAYRQDFSLDPQQRNLQIEAKAHVEVERRVRIRLQSNQPPRMTDPAYIQWLHHSFYEHLPADMWDVHGANGRRSTVHPGQFRREHVSVGAHEPPDFSTIEKFMVRFDEQYRPDKLAGAERVIAAAASHHRLLWIHPFLDGNGRVARLFTESYLIAAGVDSGGLWSISRGLSREHQQYKKLLAAADDKRRGDVDGRGNLSDQALADFCVFFLTQARDQIRFIRGLLHLDGLQERLLEYLTREVRERRIPKGANELIHQALLRGRLERGDALALLGGKERTARLHLSQLIDLGLLAPDGISHKSAVRWNIPVSAGTHYFPQLYPQTTEHELERSGKPSFIKLLRSLSPEVLQAAVEQLLSENIDQLENNEQIDRIIAETNATGFYSDECQFSISDIDLFEDDQAQIKFSFHMIGDQDLEDERTFSGDHIEGRGIFVIDVEGNCSFINIHADVAHDFPEPDQQ
jgi:Fic family protein